MELLKYIAVFGSDNNTDHDSDKQNSGLALQYILFTNFPTCVVQVYELHCYPGDNDILLITVFCILKIFVTSVLYDNTCRYCQKHIFTFNQNKIAIL